MRRQPLVIVPAIFVALGAMALTGAASAAPATRAAAGRAAGHSRAARPVVSSVRPAAGPVAGGTEVAIRGTGFRNVRSVSIGGRPARDVRVRSARMIVAVTPPHAAGNAAISVTAKAGRSGPSPVRFTFLSRPRIAGLSAHLGPVTGGQVIMIRGDGLQFVRTVMFGLLRAQVLARSSATRLRVRTPASWAGLVRVVVVTDGGTSAPSAADRFTFQNPARRLSGRLVPAPGDVVATASDVVAVTGGQAVTTRKGVRQKPWVVTLAAAAPVPAAGERYLLRPGGSAYPAGLAGTVTAVDSAASPVTITVSAAPGTVDSAVSTAQAIFSGPLGDRQASGGGATGFVFAGGPSLTSTIDFGSIDASTLNCLDPDGRSVDVSGSLSLKLEHVEAHVQVDLGSLFSKPFVDVRVSYQPTLAFSLTAAASARCTLPAAWQNTHEKLFVLGDTGVTIAIAPDAGFTVSAGGTVSFQQHSYRILGFVTNPDGSLNRLDGQSSDPAQVKVSAELKVEAYGGVQIQVGELNIIGVGMSLDGGVAATVSSDWPPRVCLSANPFLRATLYAYLNAWVKEWKLEGFSAELDLDGISTCTGTGWHVAWQAGGGQLEDATCPATQDCFVIGDRSDHGYILRTTDGGRSWAATTMSAYRYLFAVACSDASHCLAGGIGNRPDDGNGAKLLVTSDGGAHWSQVALPYYASPLVSVASLACLPSGRCYATAYMKKYSGELVYGTTNSGRTWAFDTVVDDEPDVMTCLSASLCLAGATVPVTEGIYFPAASEATKDGWASSYTGSIPKDLGELTGVACMSQSRCYGAAFGVLLLTTNFGRSWQRASAAGLGSFAVSCPTGTSCVTGGSSPGREQDVAETLDGGHTWIKTKISTFPAAGHPLITSIACPSFGHCIATEVTGDLTAIAVS